MAFKRAPIMKTPIDTAFAQLESAVTRSGVSRFFASLSKRPDLLAGALIMVIVVMLGAFLAMREKRS